MIIWGTPVLTIEQSQSQVSKDVRVGGQSCWIGVLAKSECKKCAYWREGKRGVWVSDHKVLYHHALYLYCNVTITFII